MNGRNSYWSKIRALLALSTTSALLLVSCAKPDSSALEQLARELNESGNLKIVEVEEKALRTSSESSVGERCPCIIGVYTPSLDINGERATSIDFMAYFDLNKGEYALDGIALMDPDDELLSNPERYSLVISEIKARIEKALAQMSHE